MKFGEVATAEAEGMVLAHVAHGSGGRIAKGTVLTGAQLAELAAAGVTTLTVAELEAGDVDEDAAAERVAAAIAGGGLRPGGPLSGRANLFAAHDGLLVLDAPGIAQLNAIDPTLTLATLPNFAKVNRGRLVATLKVIAFAAPEASVKACEKCSKLLQVRKFSQTKVRLIQTRLSAVKERVLDKTRAVTERRLAAYGAELVGEERCAHDLSELARLVAAAADADIVLIAGASAVADAADVLPAAISECGGEVVAVGMPVDPGNLLVLGRLDKTPVVGLPGCARSPKENGFDWVLARLLAGEELAAGDIQAMGVGGLLDEIHERPGARLAGLGDAGGKLGAILLAAGSSTRMGARNKLTEDWRGKPLVLHAAAALAQAASDGVVAEPIVVTGHESERLEELLAAAKVRLVHNPRHRSGMASSLAAGVAALGADVAGVFICLGDMPQLSPQLLARMSKAFDPAQGKDIVVPVCKGRRGHPVLFGARHFPELVAVSGDAGARTVLARNEDAIVALEAAAAVLLDLDDQQAFAQS